MSSSYGENIRLTIFGQSHSAGIGMTLEGIPAGLRIDMERLSAFMARRAPGNNAWSTTRKEADAPEFLSGLKDDTTCGAPLCAVIRNTNTRSKDYESLAVTPRPGHADYTAKVKYNGFQDYAGGGHFSGRLTAPMCIAGGILKQALAAQGIEIKARIVSIAGIKDDSPFDSPVDGKAFPASDDEKAALMQAEIEKARMSCDSVGGIVECVVTGLPAGIGDPMFDGMENRIALIIFGIPAVKGVEFGAGFECARMRGSENNDPYEVIDGKAVTRTNNCGGILGGITNGMPLVFRCAFKPTPSIAMEQDSFDMNTLENRKLVVGGRHDPCVVPRAVPVVESAAAIAVYDAWLARKREM